MFLRILKKDLQRRKMTNVILLVFILLASVCISASANNVVAVFTGIDYFYEKANMPELVAYSMQSTSADSIIAELNSVRSYDESPVRFLSPDQLTCNGEVVEDFSPNILPVGQWKFRFFDEKNEPIREVDRGQVRVSATSMRKAGLKTGDTLVFKLDNEIRKLTIAGPLKDATNVGRMYLMNAEQYEEWFLDSKTASGSICFLYTDDANATAKALRDTDDIGWTVFTQQRLRMAFFPDMILAGILLGVSICLILISFVVLRFTISFTLSEEFRQIGVMKAIGLPDSGIRRLYLAKYLLLATVGAFLGFFGSIPFSKLLLDSVSQTMVLGSENSMLINALCCLLVIGITLAYCYGCTGKVKKLTPVDAIRSGTTGERFHKKGLLRLSKTPGNPTFFLALNDVISQPRRFGAVLLTLFLCLSLVLMLTTSIHTIQSSGLIPSFGTTHFDLLCSGGYDISFTADGKELLQTDLENLETKLGDGGLESRCYLEVDYSLPLNHDDNSYTTYIYQGIRTTADQYEYFEGSAPARSGEIALTKPVAEALRAEIGDTITMKIGEEHREFIVTGFFQSMRNQGDGTRIHEDEDVSFEYLSDTWGLQIEFADDPNDREIEARKVQVEDILGVDVLRTESEYVDSLINMTQTMEYVRLLVLLISLIIIVLIVVLIGHSFIAKERADIAILKAVGFRNSQIISWQALRFVILCMIATVLALIFHIPLMNLAISPIFTGMGANFGIRYEINALEIYCIYPAIFLAVTCISAFLTAQYTRTVQTNECSNID